MMHITGWFKSLFSRALTPDQEKFERWLIGHREFEEGRRHYEARLLEEAIKCFDRAHSFGYDDDQDLFFMRAMCLQELERHQDAIKDFGRAIEFEPDDSNLYFVRAASRCAVGDRDGCSQDIQEAVRLSRSDTPLNRAYNERAREMGWDDVTGLYRLHGTIMLANLELMLERDRQNARIEALRKWLEKGESPKR